MDTKSVNNEYFYPATKASVHEYADSIFTPIRRGECVATVWVPMTGRRMWNKFLIENINVFSKELPNYKKFILTYVEPLDLTEESLSGYMRLMGVSFIESCRKNKVLGGELDKYLVVFDDEESTYTKLYESFKSLLEQVTENGFNIIFFLGEFDELNFGTSIFYNNLKSLWSRFYPQLYYVFLSAEDLSRAEMGDKYKELNAAILQNLLFIPLRKGKDKDYVVNFFESRMGCKLSMAERKLIIDYCGGHPFLTRVVSKLICNSVNRKNAKLLLAEIVENYEVLSIVRRVYGLRTDNEKDIILKLIKGEEVENSDALSRLLRLGIVEEVGKGIYKVFGKLFEIVSLAEGKIDRKVSIASPEGFLYLDKEGVVCYQGNPIEEKFTNQEYRVIKYLLTETGKLKTREQIGGIIWGEESYEKYSDWAIDQLISKARKKLKDIGTKSNIVTVRGRGYKLTS